jgi:hypothetical protein
MPVKGDKFRGIFKPEKLEEFNKQALEHIGTECEWIYLRQVAAGEWSGDHNVGEWMVGPIGTKMPFRWTFERDVEKCTQ